jgi:FdrA protein
MNEAGMASGFVIRKSQYYDSVFLMRIAKTLGDEPGVEQSAVVMATEANKELLAKIKITGSAIDAAGPNDLIVAVSAGDSAVVERLLASIDERLQSFSSAIKKSNYRTLDEAAQANPDSNLVVISVPGHYAAREAHKALEKGRHVFLFSDNVALDDEVELKQFARQHNLLVMGPDCGTCLIGGVGIGFANRVRRGPVGVVGASGTGIQEFTSLVHQAGSGISHAIGTGSHDLSDAVGGITTLMGLDLLEADAMTRVIAIISKPAGGETLNRITERMRACRKPVVACFIGLDRSLQSISPFFHQAQTIDEAAKICLSQVTGKAPEGFMVEKDSLKTRAREAAAAWRPGQRYLRGLFAGGTFCFQAQHVLRDLGIQVYSNSPLDRRFRLKNPELSLEHTVIDLGDDYFTTGKPHPMIDATQRRKRILAEAADPEVAIILLDFILGAISSPDPVGDLAGAIHEAKKMAAARGDHLTIVASVCGTDQDPQGLERQTKLLEQEEVIVFSTNAQAARFCAELVSSRLGGRNGK